MPKFELVSHVTVSAYTTVEAESVEEALAIAADRNVVIGGIGSGEDEEETWLIESADGLPENIRLADA